MKNIITDRQDEDLAFMLKFENVAWYEDGCVRILDRRIYPVRTEYISCYGHEEVASAIAAMVTQSEGPYSAAAMGMALAVYEVRDKTKEDALPFLKKAAHRLSHARPTTGEQMKSIVNGALTVIEEGYENGLESKDILNRTIAYAYGYMNENYRKYGIIGKKMAKLIPSGGTILTQCFAGTVIGTMLRECRRENKEIKLICAETRPYFQGARLTASVACDMGFDVTVITDNMPAFTMQTGKVDVFTSASDVITQDGHVVNKVGTFQMAMAAKYFGIPYYVTGTPDPVHKTTEKVVIEERDPSSVLSAFGQTIVMDGVKGYYPAFDITPPAFVTGIVTEKGVYSPQEVFRYFEKA